MDNDKNEELIKSTQGALIKSMEKPQTGELSDEALAEVTGGIIPEIMYIAHCKKCNWESRAFYNEKSIPYIAYDHYCYCPDCEGDFVVFVY